MTEPKSLQIVTDEHDDHDNDDYDYDDDDADDDDIMVGSRRNKRSSEHMLTPHYRHMRAMPAKVMMMVMMVMVTMVAMRTEVERRW